MITVKYRGELISQTKKQQEELQAANVRGVLRHVKDAYGAEAYKEAKRMLITVNDESILLRKGLRTALQDGDIVSFYPIAGGG